MFFAARLLTGALLLSATAGMSQVPRSNPSQPATIQAIRRYYQVVHARLPQLRESVIDNDDRSTEGGKITAYFQGERVVFATEQVYGETGQQQTDYLFSQQQVAFVFQRRQHYNAPYYAADFDARKTRVYEARYYFHAGQLIRWLDARQQPVPTTTPAYLLRQQQLLLDARRLRQLLQRPAGH